jgi:hypothetical protein
MGFAYHANRNQFFLGRTSLQLANRDYYAEEKRRRVAQKGIIGITRGALNFGADIFVGAAKISTFIAGYLPFPAAVTVVPGVTGYLSSILAEIVSVAKGSKDVRANYVGSCHADMVYLRLLAQTVPEQLTPEAAAVRRGLVQLLRKASFYHRAELISNSMMMLARIKLIVFGGFAIHTMVHEERFMNLEDDESLIGLVALGEYILAAGAKVGLDLHRRAIQDWASQHRALHPEDHSDEVLGIDSVVLAERVTELVYDQGDSMLGTLLADAGGDYWNASQLERDLFLRNIRHSLKAVHFTPEATILG